MLLWAGDARKTLEEAEAEHDRLAAAGFSPTAVTAVRAEKVERVLERAADAPYYRGVLAGHDDLTSLPVTPKAAVRARPEDFLTPAAARAVKYYETSGTSNGGPLPTPRLVEDVVWNAVTIAGAWSRVVARDDRAANLLPSDVAPIGDTVAVVCEYLGVPLVRCYPYATGICDFDRVAAIFARFRPTCVFAAPGLLIQLMRALKRRSVFEDVASSVAKIMLLGEVATPSIRSMLEREWSADVFDAAYGSTETGTIAATCPAKRLHVLAHAFVPEVHSHGAAQTWTGAGAALQGAFVVTTLNAFARPLLRYATEDEVVLGDGCECGSGLPLLTVRGRAAETVRVAGADLDVAAVEEVVYSVPGVTGYLIELDGSVTPNRARLVLERDVGSDADDRQVRTTVAGAFETRGARFDDVVVVGQLPAITKSGAGQKNWKRTNVRVVG